MPIHIEVDWEKLGERIAFVLMNLLALGALGAGIFFISKCTGLDAMLFVPMAAGCGLVAALILIRLYLHTAVENIVYGIFGARKKLKKAPPRLARIEGLLMHHHYAEAEVELGELYQEYADHPRVNVLLFELYADALHAPERAWALGTAYLGNPARRYDAENVELVLRLADLGVELGKTEALRKLLTAELRRSDYYANERARLTRRRDALP